MVYIAFIDRRGNPDCASILLGKLGTLELLGNRILGLPSVEQLQICFGSEATASDNNYAMVRSWINKPTKLC